MPKQLANGKSILHAGDNLKLVALAPDVCKTPSPGGPVPIPYPNIAMTSDLADGTKNVKIEGKSVALESSNLSTSTGDEAGTAGGGVVSSKTKGKVTWLLYSMDVQFEGKGVARFMDDCLHNGNASNAPGKNLGYPGVGDETGKIVCDNCGKALGAEGHPQLKPSAESNKAADKTKGRTKSAVVVNCGKGGTSSFSGVAGNNFSSLNPNTFSSLAKNFKSGKAIPTSKPTDGSAPAGNCAEQKSLFEAFKAGKFPPGPGCQASMSVVRETQNGNAPVPSCNTCKRVLTSMMCQNPPSK